MQVGRIHTADCIIHSDLWLQIKDQSDGLYPTGYFLVLKIVDEDNGFKSLGFISSIDRPNLSSIWPHEKTMMDVVEKKKSEFLFENLIEKPVLVIYPVHRLLYDFLQQGVNTGDVVFIEDIKGCQTKIYLPRDPSWHFNLETLIQEVDHGVVADGHHRLDAFKAYSEIKVESNTSLPVVWMDTDQISIYSFYRNVAVPHYLGQEFWEYLMSLADPVDTDEIWQKGRFYCFYQSQRYLMQWTSANAEEKEVLTYRDLLQFEAGLLEGWNKEYLLTYNSPFVHDEQLKKSRELPNYSVFVFQFYPISPDDLLYAVGQGIVLPPKSTWITPRISNKMMSYSIH